ncbi:MAG: hypothetical protein LKG01_04965 [Bifidobacterium subtile]|jgi:hypothetical protein|nr:hypothetical protein [Bifidobacterium subtile]
MRLLHLDDIQMQQPHDIIVVMPSCSAASFMMSSGYRARSLYEFFL